jgi:2'-5' RNA ligase
MTDASPIRSFVAVALPGAVQTEIVEGARALGLPDVKWTKKPENLHVTLKFLGPVEPKRLDELGVAMSGALAGVPRFELSLRGFGAFPTARNAKIVYAGVAGGRDRLAAVASVVEDVTERLGFAREARVFTGHVTVGRCEKRNGVDARVALEPWADRALGTVAVDEVHVYESRLATMAGQGSTYVLRSRAALGAN